VAVAIFIDHDSDHDHGHGHGSNHDHDSGHSRGDVAIGQDGKTPPTRRCACTSSAS
jgi:hypothetical protein